MSDAAITATVGANTQPFARGMQRVKKEAQVGGEAIKDLARPMERVSQGMMLLRGGAAGIAIAGVFRAAVSAANEFEAGTNASADAVRNLSKEMENMRGGIGRVAMEGVGMLARYGQFLGDIYANILSAVAPQYFDAAGAERSRRTQEQLDRFEQMRNRARGAEQAERAARERAEEQARRAAMESERRERTRIENERKQRLEEIAQLEARLSQRNISDARRLAEVQDRIARLRFAQRQTVGYDNTQVTLELRRAEVEQMEIIGRIQDSNEQKRKQAQDEYIRAEERLIDARTNAERAITDEIKRRTESITPEGEASPAVRQREERDRRRLERLAARLRRAEERGLQGQDRLRDQVADAAGNVAGNVASAEAIADRIGSVIQRGVEAAMGDTIRAREEADANLEKLAGDMEKSRHSLENIEKSLSVGVR